MKQCVLYARVSLEEQAERFGLSSQQAELRTYAQKCDYEVLREFVDDGYSGGDLGRPALQQVRDLVRNRSVSLIVVHDPDRLARKLAHQLLLTEEFEKSGVRLEFVTTPNTDNMEGRLLLNVRGVIAEYEREKIRERTMRGRREKARQGLVVGGRCPYGYESIGGIYQIEEDQASVVRFIFRSLVEEHLSIRKIIERLNEGDYKPHTSTRWAKSSVGRILRNELYTGKAYYNRRQRVEPQRGTSADLQAQQKDRSSVANGDGLDSDIRARHRRYRPFRGCTDQVAAKQRALFRTPGNDGLPPTRNSPMFCLRQKIRRRTGFQRQVLSLRRARTPGSTLL